jgi:hypothetical protein
VREPDELPRRFQLIREDGDARRPVAYGLGLPGGSVICVAWPQKSGTSFFSADNAERCALLLGGDVEWIDEEADRRAHHQVTAPDGQ